MARLAAQLRQLREEAGRPSYRQLAGKAFYSHSALSQAAAGRELPSLAVTLAFAEACGGERQEWIARWNVAATAAGAVTAPWDVPAADAEAEAEAEPAVATPREVTVLTAWMRRARQRRVGRAALAAGVVGGLVWAGFSLGWARSDGGPEPVRQPVGGWGAPVADGAFPAVDDCYRGSEELSVSPVHAVGGVRLGTVELRYSRRCAGAWARFDPDPAFAGDGAVTVTVKVVREHDGKAEASQTRYAGDHQRSDLLLLYADCARASALVTGSSGVLADATTDCASPP